MRLPDLTKTEFLDIFAGTKGDKTLGKAEAIFEGYGAKSVDTDGGRRNIVLQCKYKRNKIDHLALVGLVEMPKKKFGIGIDISVFTKQSPSYGLEYLVRSKDDLKNTPILSQSNFIKLVLDLENQYKISNMAAFVVLVGLPDKSKSDEIKELTKLFSVEGPLEMLCGMFRLKGVGKRICINKISTDQKIEGVKQERIGHHTILVYRCYLDMGVKRFGDIFPNPESLTI